MEQLSAEIIAGAPKDATHWRLIEADPTPSHAPESVSDKADIEEVAEAMIVCGYDWGGDFPELKPDPRLGRGDAAGIASFHPPAEVQAQEKPQRVSTLNRAWRWL